MFGTKETPWSPVTPQRWQQPAGIRGRTGCVAEHEKEEHEEPHLTTAEHLAGLWEVLGLGD